MLGEQFMVGEEICGAVVSIRFQEDILRSDEAKICLFVLNFVKISFRYRRMLVILLSHNNL